MIHIGTHIHKVHPGEDEAHIKVVEDVVCLVVKRFGTQGYARIFTKATKELIDNERIFVYLPSKPLSLDQERLWL